MKNPNAPVFNIIKENRSYIFWYALTRYFELREGNAALADSWLSVADRQIELDNVPQLNLEFDTQELSNEDLDIKAEWVISNSSRKWLDRDSDESRKMIRDLIKRHSDSSFLRSPSSNLKSAVISFIVVIFLVYKLKEIEANPLENLEDIEQIFNDQNISNFLDSAQSETSSGLTKKVVICSIYSRLREEVSNQSEYFYHQTTGLIGATLRYLDSEEDHNNSDRSGQYKEYLRKDVQDLLKRTTLDNK